MTDNEVIIGLATIVVFGVGAQWIGRRTGIPSLLLLLPAGLLAGDVLGLVDPEELFGETLFPLTTLLVSLLLFQSGLQLRLDDLPRDARGAVGRLVSVGLVITFLGATVVVGLVLDVPGELAFLTGAILVVSGPTVVGPMLDVVRPREPTGSVLRWEGTTLDPIGAVLGVVVLNLVLASDRGGLHPIVQMLGRLGLGLVVGLAAAALFVFVMSNFFVTDSMEAAVAMLFAVGAFAVADVVLSEAGLFATVTMGFVVANQRFFPTHRIVGFGDTLEVLIIGILFILLGALVSLDALWDHAPAIVVIVAVLVLVVRPLTVAVALMRTSLTGRERMLIGWMDPRGIVAAATAAQFTRGLTNGGYDADFLLPVVFGVILGTGLVYGLTAEPVARLVDVARPAPTGVGLLGDDPWLLPFARCLAANGVPTLLFASPSNAASGEVAPAAAVRVESTHRSSEETIEVVRDVGLAKVVVSGTPDPWAALVESTLIEVLGRRHTLQVEHGVYPSGIAGIFERYLRAPPFGGGFTRDEIAARLEAGATIGVLSEPVADGSIVLAAVSSAGVVDLQLSHHPHEDDVLIGIVAPD